ncbi:MAG: hypothetical protein RR543_05345 [Erysipelotrichales bacterium]
MTKEAAALRNKRIIGAILVIGVLFAVGKEVYTTFVLKDKINVAQTENKKLKGEAEKLGNEVKKLQDESYIGSYISGSIYATDDNSQVIIVSDDEKESATKDKKTKEAPDHKNKILFGVGALVALAIIFIAGTRIYKSRALKNKASAAQEKKSEQSKPVEKVGNGLRQTPE